MKIIRLKRLKTNPFYSKTHRKFQKYLHIVSHLSSSSVISLFPYPTFLPSWMLHPQILSGREKLSNPRQNIYEGQLCFSLWMQQKPSYRAVFADCWFPVGADGSWSVVPHIFKKVQVWHTKTSYIAHLMMHETLRSILLLSAWLRGRVFQLCFILWINYSLVECVCVYVWVRVFFVIAKGNGRAHLPHPDLIFLNALTPWQLLMHLQCQSHSSELQRWRETETWGDRDMGRWGGMCVQGWGGEVATRHSLCLRPW